MRIWIIPLVLALAACGSSFDCRDICKTQQSCVGVNVDISECADRCSRFADQDSTTKKQVEQCNECRDSRGCDPACNSLCSFVSAPVEDQLNTTISRSLPTP